MPQNTELMLALIIPFAVILFLRINAAMVFLSLCLGYVLVQRVADDANSLISFLAPQTDSISGSSLRLGMLFVPVILTCFITIFSMRGRLKNMFNALPAAACSVLAVLLSIPLLTPGLRYSLQSDSLWGELVLAQSAIVGLGALVSLLFLWTQRRSSKRSE